MNILMMFKCKECEYESIEPEDFKIIKFIDVLGDGQMIRRDIYVCKECDRRLRQDRTDGLKKIIN